jgi:hypothetical protein
MKRRDLLRNAISTSALAATAASETATAQTPPPQNQDAPKLQLSAPDAVAEGSLTFFTRTEFETLETLARTLVPGVNGRPGAIEADVPRFLDFLLSQSPPDRQTLYRQGLAALAGKSMTGDVLAPLAQPWTFSGPADSVARFLRAAKDDILQATTNSREWAAANKTRTGAGTGYYYFPIE